MAQKCIPKLVRYAQHDVRVVPDSKEVTPYYGEVVKRLETELKIILQSLVNSQFARLDAINTKDELLGGC